MENQQEQPIVLYHKKDEIINHTSRDGHNTIFAAKGIITVSLRNIMSWEAIKYRACKYDVGSPLSNDHVITHKGKTYYAWRTNKLKEGDRLVTMRISGDDWNGEGHAQTSDEGTEWETESDSEHSQNEDEENPNTANSIAPSNKHEDEGYDEIMSIKGKVVGTTQGEIITMESDGKDDKEEEENSEAQKKSEDKMLTEQHAKPNETEGKDKSVQWGNKSKRKDKQPNDENKENEDPQRSVKGNLTSFAARLLSDTIANDKCRA